MNESVKIEDVRVGDYIRVVFKEESYSGRVTKVHADILNGLPGVDYIVHSHLSDQHRWCYLYQIVEIIK